MRHAASLPGSLVVDLSELRYQGRTVGAVRARADYNGLDKSDRQSLTA